MLPNFDRLLVLSFGFFILFTSFELASSLSGHIMRENGFGNIGFYALAIRYLVFGFSSFFTLSIVKRFGTKRCFVVAPLGFTTFVASFILPAYRAAGADIPFSKNTMIAILIFASALCGFASSVLWVSQGRYLAECAS